LRETKLKKTTCFGGLSAVIRENEKRFVETFVLMTKEVYVPYRENILLHKVAKQAFIELQTSCQK
jgi:hypothetical protein